VFDSEYPWELTMNFSGDVEIKTSELPDALEFDVTREGSLYESVFAPVITFVALYFFWKIAHGWSRIILIFIAVSSAAPYVANRLQGRESKLRLTSEEVTAEGNIGRVLSTKFRIAATDVTAIRFEPGGEGGTPGLYVRHGWAGTCVIPNLNSEQADLIVDAIARRFPHLPTEHSDSKSWLGDRPIELGLSKLDRDDSEKKF
jgi:hypothetical protein